MELLLHDNADTDALLELYATQIRSHLERAAPVWDPLMRYQQLFEHYEMEQHLKRQWPVLFRMRENVSVCFVCYFVIVILFLIAIGKGLFFF